MFDKRLEKAPSEPTFDAWMFRFGTATGISLRNESVEDVHWGSGDVVRVEHGPSRRAENLISNLRQPTEQRKELCTILLFHHSKPLDRLRSWVESRIKMIDKSGLAPDEHILRLAESLSSDYSQTVNHCDVAYRRPRDSDFLDFIRGLREDGIVARVNKVLEEIGSTLRLGPSSGSPTKGDKYTAKIAGFHKLSTPKACDTAAQAVLSEVEADTSARSGWRILRRGGDCAEGNVLWARFADKGISGIDVFRDEAFTSTVEITGEPIPVRLLDQFLAYFDLAKANGPLQLKGEQVTFDGRASAWTTIDTKTDSVVAFLTAGGDPKRVVIRGVTEGPKLAGLVRFAVNTRGAKFEVLGTPKKGQVLKVTYGDGEEVWLVFFDDDLNPRHWVGLADGAHVEDGRHLDMLLTLMRAVSRIDSKSYEYDPDRIPPRWTIHSGNDSLVVQPLANAPYLLVGWPDGGHAFSLTRAVHAAGQRRGHVGSGPPEQSRSWTDRGRHRRYREAPARRLRQIRNRGHAFPANAGGSANGVVLRP